MFRQKKFYINKYLGKYYVRNTLYVNRITVFKVVIKNNLWKEIKMKETNYICTNYSNYFDILFSIFMIK